MAPRKDATGHAPSASQSQQDASSEGIEDFELPRLLVTQLATSILPPDAKLDGDSITALVKGSTVFINYLTSAAQDIAGARAHKTISGADVLKALENLQFGELVTAFQGELEVFRQGSKNKSKAVMDPKGKGSESAATQYSIPSAAPDVFQAEEPHELEHASNGVSAVDVEMRDVREQGMGSHEAKVVLPIE
ncbi:histone-fold-containing protein [Gautieria morchelliformis]|nr:histone-fold-containing protein [Gautieria morchelliformis]